MTGALRGAKGFFTLLPPNYQSTDFFATQRKTADSIAGAVKASGVPHVVMLSSIGADLAAGNGPIKGLHYLENALRAAGVKLTAVRAGSFQENVANVLEPAKKMGIFPNFAPSADYPMPESPPGTSERSRPRASSRPRRRARSSTFTGRPTRTGRSPRS